MKNTNIKLFLKSIDRIYETDFKEKKHLKVVIEKEAHKFGINIFYYDGSNAINTLEGDVNLFLNNSQAVEELITATIQALSIFLKKMKGV